LCSGLVFGYLFRLRPHDVDRSGVKVRLDVGSVICLDHLDAGSAVFGDLVDVGTFHQAEANIWVPQAVSPSRSAFAVEPIFFVQDRLKKFALPLRKNEVCRSRKAQFFGPVLNDVCSVLVLARLVRVPGRSLAFRL
jgi:hypothetical protein